MIGIRRRPRRVPLERAVEAILASAGLSEAANELRRRHRDQRFHARRWDRRGQRLLHSCRYGGEASLLLVLLLLPWAVIDGIRNQRAARRALEPESVVVSRRGACFSCGYDVRSLPRPMAARALKELDVGPIRCPECGAAWPLVPPDRARTG